MPEEGHGVLNGLNQLRLRKLTRTPQKILNIPWLRDTEVFLTRRGGVYNGHSARNGAFLDELMTR